MSRRPPNPAAERAAKNQATIKSLLKLEPNKMCSDCKRNKHPRWASWNLGVFICIRCSGIHRSMGVHISKVKSVDLDSWTDEQLQSVLNWGNARANKYWEAKLAPGHVPSEAKIENFIRTKYELKRWVMDGPMPDPSTLGTDADDDVPLSIVKEKQTIERKQSLKTHPGQPSASARPAPQVDLIGGDDPIPRASTAGPVASKVPPKAEPAPPKSTSANNSLLGLDFLGSQPSPPPRPASTTGSGGVSGQSRPDLKQSILSLYATAPRPQQASHGHSHSGSFGSMASPTAPPQMSQHVSQPSGGGLNDAFSNLSFTNISSPKSPQNSAFSNLNPVSSNRSTPQPQQSSSAFSGLSGGGFFDSKPAAPAAAPVSKPAASNSGFGGFGGFGDFSSPAAAQPKPAAPASSAMNDLFDFSAPAPAAAPPPAAPAVSSSSNSVFNLTQPKSPPAPATTNSPLATMGGGGGGGGGGGFSGADVWGGNAWADPAPAPAASKPVTSPQPSNDFGAWGSNSGGGGAGTSTMGSFANTAIVPGASGGLVTQPKVAADEEFGGWTSSTAPPATAGAAKGSEDLFSNVWQ
ncbi:stromal membrane-associated protein 1 [Diaporthe eres]|uniref:Arf-GAP domain-containing protein n=1 Tax=Diaporthe vaccinii TaxID=105482 RepID=A0ABR4EMS4_9PEZI|nr:stromal membrane-associated protein 1 [Diaporthe eres]